MIGVFSEKSLNPNGADGMIHGEFRLFGVQVLAVVVVSAYSAVITLILLLAIRKVLGFRVSDAEEDLGVDHSEHGEAAYAEFAMVGYTTHDNDSVSHLQISPSEMKKRKPVDERTPLKEDL
jgi:ammonia channel protein AmtB